jgi:uncharacterized protein (DUF305 family)
VSTTPTCGTCRYHPVGFSYVAGGAHTSCTSSTGEAGECPELGGETGSSTLQYFVDGSAVTSDDSGFGLDAYEPLFFNSQGWWAEKNTANAFKVTLTIPADASYTRAYYFCHIHAGMSAEIEIVGSSASTPTVLNAAVLGSETQASAQAIYHGIVNDEQVSASTFDEACGTHASSAFDPSASHSSCSGKSFLCGPGASGTYETCLQAIDCQMHHDMAVSVPSTSTSKFATFARQMIPHHQNAVAMAKVLLKHSAASDYPTAGTEDQDQAWAADLAHAIINNQNFQIQQMQGWVEANSGLAGESSQCYTTDPITSSMVTTVESRTRTAGVAPMLHRPLAR